jgi:hypothetical protein
MQGKYCQLQGFSRQLQFFGMQSATSGCQVAGVFWQLAVFLHARKTVFR